MSKHEQKYCPRCAAAFECKPGNINQCQCSGIKLTVEERVYLESKHEDCLCISCLMAMQQEYYFYKEKNVFK